jgi:hypothetical protein
MTCLHNLDAHDAALIEHEALAHDVVLARVLAERCGRLSVAVVNAEDARPHRPRVVRCAALWRLVHQLQVDHLREDHRTIASEHNTEACQLPLSSAPNHHSAASKRPALSICLRHLGCKC